MNRRARSLLLFALPLLLSACQTAVPAAPEPEPIPEELEIAMEAVEEPIGMARVTANRLNVRTGPSTNDEIVASVTRNQRVTLLANAGEWSRVALASGERGWAASRYLREEKGCPPDRDFEIIESPPMTFSDSGAHGTVVVEATVGADGIVRSTRVLSNDTGDPALGELAVAEIAKARFKAPVRNCVAKRFIYTYRRTY